MIVLVAVGAGFLAGRLVWLALRETFSKPLFARANYRGHVLATSAGLVLPVSLVLVEAGRVVAGAAGVGNEGGVDGPRGATLLLSVGLGLLGAFDDLGGDGDARGFRGHVAELARGRLSTGGLKLVGGAALALVACAPLAGDSLVGLLRDGALVALGANLGNLLDRAPGRTLKVSTLAFAALVVLAGSRAGLAGVAVVAGAGLALLVDDLHERLMLGDAGSNVLGGAVAFGVVVTCAPGTRLAALVGVVVLNALSEVVSFSRVIAAVPPLRALDQAGRRRR